MGAKCVSTPTSRVDHVSVTLNADGSGLKAFVVFPTTNTATYSGNVSVKDYGSISFSPYSAASPLQFGFDLKTSLFSDLDYAAMTPSDELANGMPLGSGKKMVEIDGGTGDNRQTFYGYADMKDQVWLGAAAIFGSTLDDNFPAGLMLTQYYKLDEGGQPQIVVFINGPKLNTDNSIQTVGQVSIFANVRDLMASGLEPGKEYTYKKAKEYYTPPSGVPTPTPTPTATPTPTPTPDPGADYTIVSGQRVEKELTVPCSLQFNLRGIKPVGENGDKAHLTWAYNPDFAGGNPSGIGYVAGVRDYKVKVYDKDGVYIKEPRYNIEWNPSTTYTVKLEVNKTSVTTTISSGGTTLTSITVDADAPDTVTIGYGWPPSQRPGISGGVVNSVVWSQ